MSGIFQTVMKPRMLRRWLSGWLVMAMLFTQLAIAAYACPQMPMPGQPCAEMMTQGIAPDVDQPGLCHQHCLAQTPTQAADHATPMVVATLALLLFVLLPTAVVRSCGCAWLIRQRRRDRDRAPPPPHSILHCCHRI